MYKCRRLRTYMYVPRKYMYNIWAGQFLHCELHLQLEFISSKVLSPVLSISCQLVSGKSWITCEDYNFFICEGRITIQHATEEVSDDGRHGLCQDSFDNLHRRILGECFRCFSSRPEQADHAWLTVRVNSAELSWQMASAVTQWHWQAQALAFAEKFTHDLHTFYLLSEKRYSLF